jgi:hypothetical protein
MKGQKAAVLSKESTAYKYVERYSPSIRQDPTTTPFFFFGHNTINCIACPP